MCTHEDLKHYVKMPMQNHDASYHGIFAIQIGINEDFVSNSCHVNILYSVERLQEIVFDTNLSIVK